VDRSGREIVEVGTHRRGIVEELEKAHYNGFVDSDQNESQF